MSPRIRKLYTFPIDAHLAAGLKRIKTRDGVSVSEQIRRAIAAWLKKKGITSKGSTAKLR